MPPFAALMDGRAFDSAIRSPQSGIFHMAKARNTSTINAYARSPWLTAISALDLDELSGGRFVLGLGTGNRREFLRPSPEHLRFRAAEILPLLRAAALVGILERQ